MGDHPANGTTKCPKRVAITGAGVTGLLLAQGLMKNGFDVTVYERDPSIAYRDHRPVSFLVHWGFEAVQAVLPADLWQTIDKTFCNPSHDIVTPNPGITFFNGHTGELLFKAPDSTAVRVTRQGLRRHFSKDVRIRFGLSLESFEAPTDGEDGEVKLKFSDGSVEATDILVGADGSRSKIRHLLMGEEKAALTKSDFVCGYASVVVGKETAEAMLKAHPIWSMAYHSMGVLAFGTEHADDPNDPSNWVFNITRIWRGDSPNYAAANAVKVIKDQSEAFCEPFHSAVSKMTDQSPAFVRQLSQWRSTPWPNAGGRVTLAGDAAHAMLPFRGQGLNHAMQDAQDLMEALVGVAEGQSDLKEAIDKYGDETAKRGAEAVNTAESEGKIVQNMDMLFEMAMAKKGLAK